MVRELKVEGVKLKEKKVLIIGDAGAGKTSLSKALRGEKKVAVTLATDGIELSEFHFEGVRFYCWDFAGQEIYRYTHQFFLSEGSVYLVLFDLRDPIPAICSQLTYWLDWIAYRAPSSQIRLVGTHASLVSGEKSKQLCEQVAQKFGEIGRNLVVVDSMTLGGLERLKKILVRVTLRNLLRVPRSFDEFRLSLKKYQETHRAVPFVEENCLKKELEESGMLVGLTHESWEWSLQVLNCLGSIVLIDRDCYTENNHTRSTFVILRPSWLVDAFKSVVTMRHIFVKDGVVSIEKLRNMWHGIYDVSVHELLFEALEKFEVVCRLSGRGEGKVIVPCLLPDCPPRNFSMLVQSGSSGLSSLGLPDEPSLTQTFRRSFLLIKENSRFPAGVMGKLLSSMLQLGKVRYVWKTGCVVVCDENNVVIMWEGWCGRRMGIHFVFYTADDPFSLSEDSSMTILKLLQRASQVMQNLLEDFYLVDYEAIIPCIVDASGVPIEWARVDDVLLARYNNESSLRVVRRKGEEGGVVEVRSLGPDLTLDQGSLRFFEEEQIKLKRFLGMGAYSELWEGLIQLEDTEGSPQTKKVTVKKILLDQRFQKSSFQEILKKIHHEIHFSLQVQHPNVVELVGICSETKPPLLLLESLDEVFFLLLLYLL